MAKRNTVTVTVFGVERGPVSSFGNPSYVFKTDHGDYRTMANAGMAYGLENDFRVKDYDQPLKGQSGPGAVELETTPAGRVTGYRIIGEG